MATSEKWGEVSCPNCDLVVCIHEEGWHLDGELESDDFGELSKFVDTHHASHTDTTTQGEKT